METAESCKFFNACAPSLVIKIFPSLMRLAFDFMMFTLLNYFGKYMVCNNIKTVVNFNIGNMSVLNTDRISYNQHSHLPVVGYHIWPNGI